MEDVKISVYNIVGNSFCVAADDGQLVYEVITRAFNEKKRVKIDFQNIEMITSAFLNTAIGQLYGKYDQDTIRQTITVENMLADDMALLKRVVDTAKLFYSNPEQLQNSVNEILEE